MKWNFSEEKFPRNPNPGMPRRFEDFIHLKFARMSSFFSLRLVLILGCLFLVQCAPYSPGPKGEKIFRNVVFSNPQPGVKLKMDLYVPKTEKPAPVVVWIFGGSWKFGWKSFHVVLRDLTKYGIAVASIQYRVSEQATYPAQIYDCHDAAQWLRENGAKYGIDPTKIGASGESAGGHLAALMGTCENTPNIKAVCALYPPTDMVKLGREYFKPTRPSAIDLLFGGPIETKLQAAREASPMNHVSSKSPPFYLIHGANDELVKPFHSIDFQKKLQAAGVEAELVIVPNKKHWFSLTDDQISKVAAFFNRHFETK